MHACKIINSDCSDEDAHVRNKHNEWNALNALKPGAILPRTE